MVSSVAFTKSSKVRKLKEFFSNHREGYASLELDGGFFRPDSILARDLSVLITSIQFDEKNDSSALRWLDLMSGSGVRSLRWGIESALSNDNQASFLRNLEIWVNDADSNRTDLIKRNLQPLLKKRVTSYV